MLLAAKTNRWDPSFLIDDIFYPLREGKTRLPEVNIREMDSGFELDLAIPGKKKEDIKIDVENGMLIVSSESKSENEESLENGNFIRKEFAYKSFERRFTLPESVDEAAVKAKYEHGILNISLPKREEALPKPKKQIEIA